MEMAEKGQDTVIGNVINDLEIAKRILTYPNPLGVSIRIKIGQAITEAIELLKQFEAREMTIDEWYKWKADTRRDPICMVYENDDTPIWVMNPNAVHEPALLMGRIKLFLNKPTHEQCMAIKWNTNVNF